MVTGMLDFAAVPQLRMPGSTLLIRRQGPHWWYAYVYTQTAGNIYIRGARLCHSTDNVVTSGVAW